MMKAGDGDGGGGRRKARSIVPGEIQMYPVSLGFNEALRRIELLSKNGHHAEALLTSVFTFEKTARRALRLCIVARGFTSKQAEALLKSANGIARMKEFWPVFAKGNETMQSLTGSNWQYLMTAQTMRNKLVHGERVYNLDECKAVSEKVVVALRTFKGALDKHLERDVWTYLPRRSSAKLQWFPE
jgi:hypothetical protein